jgi:hypothetical protein
MEYGSRGVGVGPTGPLYAVVARSPHGGGGTWFGRAWLDGETIASVCVDGVTDAHGGRHACRKRLEHAIAEVHRTGGRR